MTRRTLPRIMTLFAVWIGACSQPDYGAVMPARSLGSIPALRATLQISDETLAAADPTLAGFDGWPLVFDASAPPSLALHCELVVSRGASQLAVLEGTLASGQCTTLWDGNLSGTAVTPGPLSVEARLVNAAGEVAVSAVQSIEVLRLGLDRIELSSPAATRAALLYRRTGGRAGAFHELAADGVPFGMAPDRTESGGSALELPSGVRREVPAPWSDLLSPPLDARSPDGVEHDTYNLPVAMVAGTNPSLLAHVSTMAAGGVSGEALDTEVRLVVPAGLSINGDDRMRDGSSLTFEHDASPVPLVGRFDVTYDFSFEARRMGGEFRAMPGVLSITLRYYGLAGMPVFFSNSLPHRTWVDVIDRIAEWVGGESADPDEVGARLVAGVYYELGLHYDTARGASFYTNYASRNFGDAVFDMQAFEERSHGTTVNCSDSASILSSYANMVGLDFRYHILTHVSRPSFDLNFIQAIGGTMFDDTPFDSGRGEFSYHAIVGGRDGFTWDATLAVDGDGAPESRPNTLLLVQHIAPAAYLDALSSEASNVLTTHDDRVRIR